MKNQIKSPGDANERSAGILLHITSLPSRFGVGDIGPAAFAFADFLAEAKQNYWQLLPLSPTGKAQQYSPYSASSSMAGNTLLISPELLAFDGLLSITDLKNSEIRNTGKCDYRYAEKIRKKLFHKAFKSFQKQSSDMAKDFEVYKEREAMWLTDFALFEVLKNKNGSKPWYEWDKEEMQRKPAAMSRASNKFSAKIEQIKWLQFIFDRQWSSLKTYCTEKEISLFGDLPFYVSHDSVDVWANKDFFAVDEKGKLKGVAGVPPDYFNADGQLWGMPVFDWDALEKQNFKWWIDRLRKNIELFDIVRLDHFRAFADYWEVPASERTAKNGSWKRGPGSPFFKSVRDQLGYLPFVAEDLGDINDAVHKLRQQFNFPGMKILQFAFGGDFPMSGYLPHNYTSNFVAYTGTHDNNTTKGWYRKDLSKIERNNINDYLGKKVDATNVSLELIRIAYGSVARSVIVPMQDVLNLNESARMNTPASVKNNWLWRMKSKEMPEQAGHVLRTLSELYDRA
ncbi:MAG TPA: 4-alpha-glucanotransferase [Chryseosolibacter sp.]|nr:4-alpha-glucanotransferase [Chryseosolibacter sp.]